MQELNVIDTFRFIEPGPVLLVTTQDKQGPNVMTCGFHMMMRHDAPLIGCILGPWDYSYEIVRRTKQAVLAVPDASMAKAVVDIGNCSGSELDKFANFNLKTQRGRPVKAPLLADCIANIECRLIDETLADRYNLHIFEVVRLWAAPDRQDRKMLHHVGDGRFHTQGEDLDHSGRMTKWRHLAR